MNATHPRSPLVNLTGWAPFLFMIVYGKIEMLRITYLIVTYGVRSGSIYKSMENDIFKKEGLKIEKDRVLPFSQLRCPLGCRYCFVDDINFNQQEKVAYLTEKQLSLLSQLPAEVKIIMPGCDTELFQNNKDALSTLWALSDLQKDIAVITRLFLSPRVINELILINKKLQHNGNLLTVSVSLPCLSSSKQWEPKGTTPQRRIKMMEYATNA